ncbi:MAG: M56 family metallopeptidase [Chloroflexota bacterium]
MHTFFLLSALLLSGLLAGLGAAVLRLGPAGGRRAAALTVLAFPPAILAIAAHHVIPRFWMQCSPLAGWDRIATFGILVTLAAVVAGALVINVARLILVERLLARCRPLDDTRQTSSLKWLAARAGARVPSVRLLEADSPLAVAGGLRRPAIVLSTWLMNHLDAAELEAVFAHELVHVTRRDYLTRWFARFLRDATVYLPSAWYALRVLEMDEELQADAEAVSLTERPLAMASALGKVWRAALSLPQSVTLAGLPSYNGGGHALLEERLTRLLSGPAEWKPSLLRRLVVGAGLASIGGLSPRLLVILAAALPLVCTMRPR